MKEKEMNYQDNALYQDDLKYVAEYDMNWNKLKNSSILIVGATSMIGKCLVDVLLKKNSMSQLNIDIICAGRDLQRLKQSFNNNANLKYVQLDVVDKDQLNSALSNYNTIDYIVNLSSPTKSNAIKEIPIQIFEANVIGTRNLLEICKQKKSTYIFASSLDVYGNNIYKIDKFKETENGEIDTMSNRACYFESKRMAETLCNCYAKQHKIDFYIFRFPRVFGPTMNEHSRFLISNWIMFECLEGRDPHISTEGKQTYSFLYVFDTVSGMLKAILDGNKNTIYNIADDKCSIKVVDLANYVCNKLNKKLFIDINKEKQKFFEPPYDKILDSSKLKELKWNSKYTIYESIDRMIKILKSKYN